MVKTKMPHDAIPGFELIAPTIWDRIPSTPSTPTEDNPAPSLILLLTWTGAHGRHISKYTAQYSALFPSSHIMVITTSPTDLLFRSPARKQHRLQPAIKYISNLQHIPRHATGGILLHIFSEGGSNKACELATAYRAATGSPLPLSALYLDSTPGHPRFALLRRALANSLPPVPGLAHIAPALAAVLLGLVWLLYLIAGSDGNPISRSRKQLLDPELFDQNAHRCYLYSKADQLIAWQDVCQHAGMAMQGAAVSQVVFEDSAHVAHARSEPGRYWGAVSAVWKMSQRGGCEGWTAGGWEKCGDGTKCGGEKEKYNDDRSKYTNQPEPADAEAYAFPPRYTVLDPAIQAPSRAIQAPSRPARNERTCKERSWSTSSQRTLIPGMLPALSKERLGMVESRLYWDGFV